MVSQKRPADDYSDRWAGLKFAAGAFVTIMTAGIIAFGGNVISATGQVPSIADDVKEMKGTLKEMQDRINEGMLYRYTAHDARRDQGVLWESLKENRQRIRDLEINSAH